MAGGLLYGSALEDYLRQQAVRRNLDAAALISVVEGEGGFNGAVGDNGTSFGPFQMHWGGAMPRQYVGNYQASKTFANSPAGINYALAQIGSVAAGLRGDAAIQAIVARFERPAAPAPEIAADEQRIGQPVRVGPPTRPSRPTGEGAAGSVSSNDGGVLGFLEGLIPGYGVVHSVTDFLKIAVWLLQPKTWLRMVEFLAGSLLILLGLVGLGVLLVRKSGVVGDVADFAGTLPGPAGRAGRAVSTVRQPRRTVRREAAARRQSASRDELAARRQQREQETVRRRAERDELDAQARGYESADELHEVQEERRRQRSERARERAQQASERARRRGPVQLM